MEKRGVFGAVGLAMALIIALAVAGCSGDKGGSAPVGAVKFTCMDLNTTGTTDCSQQTAAWIRGIKYAMALISPAAAHAETIYSVFDGGTLSKIAMDHATINAEISNTTAVARRGFFFIHINELPGCGDRGWIMGDVALAANTGTYTMLTGLGIGTCGDLGPARLTAYFYDTTDDPSLPDNWITCCAGPNEVTHYATTHEPAAVATINFTIVD